MNEIELKALIEAIVIQLSGVSDGIRPSWESHQESAEEAQEEIDDFVDAIYEDFIDIKMDNSNE